MSGGYNGPTLSFFPFSTPLSLFFFFFFFSFSFFSLSLPSFLPFLLRSSFINSSFILSPPSIAKQPPLCIVSYLNICETVPEQKTSFPIRFSFSYHYTYSYVPLVF
ncbi:hypothetical protein BCR41DRAFT_8100 [Lobosporangium transversale]|uniref:Uncharacterized protein n=1 Tax=Lobosporangium transversale TaxID=64571 RepID=A0A1Y2H2Y4_9FUNG|nr:hypothetical protein BCR41DRAFT_8100 [Lobosporangium transversale]ORZ28908.1 hypothetical protein BCR41DRAFT_8100 [Lobosporangium transversale]|eukprot:XP_021886581.1 hypothetical protein BCR41DRAFT_8100 [Lobosporangium transversale]